MDWSLSTNEITRLEYITYGPHSYHHFTERKHRINILLNKKKDTIKFQLTSFHQSIYFANFDKIVEHLVLPQLEQLKIQSSQRIFHSRQTGTLTIPQERQIVEKIQHMTGSLSISKSI